jgi:hypothetical protein
MTGNKAGREPALTAWRDERCSAEGILPPPRRRRPRAGERTSFSKDEETNVTRWRLFKVGPMERQTEVSVDVEIEPKLNQDVYHGLGMICPGC